LIADTNLQATSTEVDGTTINLYLNPDTSVGDGAEIALTTAARALQAYSARYGQYPYDELDLVETDLASSVLAVSWSGLIFLEGPNYLAGMSLADYGDGADFTIAHEIGHQWWGALVGANSNDHTFMNEGLDNALTSVFFEDTFGEAVAREQIQQQIAGRYLNALAQSGDGVVDLPLTAPREGPSRGALDYGKAAIGFLAIRQEIGDEAFFAALADYTDRFAFDNATPDDLREAFERASGEDLQEVWRFWFNAAETTSEDVWRVVGTG
jgi:aminopeptidase N